MTTRSLPHRVASQLGTACDPIADHLSRSVSFQPSTSHEDRTRFVYGQVDLSCLKRNPLDFGLPELIHLNHREEPLREGCSELVKLIHKSQQSAQPGWHVTVKRLAEIVFLNTLRAAISLSADFVPPESSDRISYPRAATDIVVGPILQAMHESPEKPWTVPHMARQARVSKSAFSERFRNLVGQPPLQYLTEVRMQRACKLLRETKVEIAEIAILVGYEAPSSFSSAFKKWHGESPVDYRRANKN